MGKKIFYSSLSGSNIINILNNSKDFLDKVQFTDGKIVKIDNRWLSEENFTTKNKIVLDNLNILNSVSHLKDSKLFDIDKDSLKLNYECISVSGNNKQTVTKHNEAFPIVSKEQAGIFTGTDYEKLTKIPGFEDDTLQWNTKYLPTTIKSEANKIPLLNIYGNLLANGIQSNIYKIKGQGWWKIKNLTNYHLDNAIILLSATLNNFTENYIISISANSINLTNSVITQLSGSYNNNIQFITKIRLICNGIYDDRITGEIMLL